MANEQFDPQKFKQETEETLSVVQDSLVSFAANLAAEMKKSVKAVADEADKTITKKVGKDFVKAFNDMAKEVKTMRSNNDKFLAGQKSAAQLKRDRLRLEDKLAVLERARQEAEKHGYELGEERLQQINEYKAQLQEIIEEQEKQNEALNKKVAGLVGVFDKLSNIPIAKDLLNSADAAEAMKKALLEGGGSMKAFGKGIAAAFKGIEKASIILFVIKKTVDAFKFLVDTMFMAQESSVGLAQIMGTTVEEGNRIKTVFNSAGKNIYHNFGAVRKVMEGVKSEFGQVSMESGDVLRNATFLTERLGIGANEAAKLNLVFSSFGQNAEESTEKVNKLIISLAESEGYVVPLDTVMKDIAESGDEMSGYFGFSAEKLGEAALKTRQFGLALSQTKSVASGLLDFEKSISSELELRLLTGKNISLDAARQAALQGDTAEATSLVLKQLEKIPAAQRKNPIIMQQMAEAAGLTGDQLNRAFLLTQKTTKALKFQKDEYQRILDTEGKAEAEKFRARTKLSAAEVKDMKARVPLQQQLSDSLTKMQESLSTLFPVDLVQRFINSIDEFTVAVADFIERVNRTSFLGALFGGGKLADERYVSEDYKDLSKADLTKQLKVAMAVGAQEKTVDQKYVDELAQKYGKEVVKDALTQVQQGRFGKDIQDLRVEDFVIRTHPKDSLVMAGGTKFADETNTLLRELITAVKSGGHVYIDGRKVGETLALNYTAIG